MTWGCVIRIYCTCTLSCRNLKSIIHLSRITSTSCSECCMCINNVGGEVVSLTIQYSVYMHMNDIGKVMHRMYIHNRPHIVLSRVYTYPFHTFFEHLINEEGEILRRAIIQVYEILKVLHVYTAKLQTRP